MKTVINCKTGEIIERNLDVKEIAQQQMDEDIYATAMTIADAAAKTKAETKAALLAKLGITADEAKLLLSQWNT